VDEEKSGSVTPEPAPPQDGGASGAQAQAVTQEKALELLSTVLDPELGINIVDLGLVYWVAVSEGAIDVDFTLTYPGCPIGPMLEEQIQQVLKEGTGVSEVRTRIVWEPVWSSERMSEAARLELGYPI